MTFRLMRPGVTLMGGEEFGPITPVYPFRFEDPKVGDKVYILVESEDEMAIVSTKIIDVADHYDYAVETYEYRQSVLRGEFEVPYDNGKPVDFSEFKDDPAPDPLTRSNYAIDFWIDNYNTGIGLSFGETLYRTFEEARSVMVQYFYGDHDDYMAVLNATEDELAPSKD